MKKKILFLIMICVNILICSENVVAAAGASEYEPFYLQIRKSESGIMDDEDYYRMYIDQLNANSMLKDARVSKILYAYLLDITGDGKEELFIKEEIKHTSSSYTAVDGVNTCEWIRVFESTENGLRRIGQSLTCPLLTESGSYSYYEPTGYIGAILSSYEYPNVSDDCLYYCVGDGGKVYLADDMPTGDGEKKFSFYSYNGSNLEREITFSVSFANSWYVNKHIHSSRGTYLYYINGERVEDDVFSQRLNHYTLYERRHN